MREICISRELCCLRPSNTGSATQLAPGLCPGPRANWRESVKLYERLAKDIEGQVRRGVFRYGDRIPSVRQTSQHHKLSITTVIRVYWILTDVDLCET